MGDDQPSTDDSLGPVGPGDLRASDAERQSVVDLLREHTAAGRLQMDEFEDRAGQAFAARTHRELQVLLRDLPGGGPAQLPLRPRPARPGSGAADPVRPAWPAPGATGSMSGPPAGPVPRPSAVRLAWPVANASGTISAGAVSAWGDITGAAPVGTRPGRHGHPHHHGRPSRHDRRPRGRWGRVRYLGFSPWFVELAVVLTGIWAATGANVHDFWPVYPLASTAFFAGGWRPGRHGARRPFPGSRARTTAGVFPLLSRGSGGAGRSS